MTGQAAVFGGLAGTRRALAGRRRTPPSVAGGVR